MKNSVIKYLKDRGYTVEYEKFSYWDNMPWAIKVDGKEEIRVPLCIQYNNWERNYEGLGNNNASSVYTLSRHNLPTFERIFDLLEKEYINLGFCRIDLTIKKGNIVLMDEYEDTIICKTNY